MKPVTARGLDNAIKMVIQSPEFDRLRLFLQADASQGDKEGEEIIKTIGDEIRNHLVTHQKAVAALKRGL